MRMIMGSALVLGLALPVVAADMTQREHAQDLLSDVRAERFRLEGESSKEARVALRFVKKGERSLVKLVKRYQADVTVDHKKVKLFAKAGQWIQRARDTGAVGDTAAPVVGWNDAYADLLTELEDAVDAAVDERDRLVTDRLREKVTRRLDKALSAYDAAGREGDPTRQALQMARALQQVSAAFDKAHGLCMKETRPNCPTGVVGQNHLLTYRGRGSLTVFDMSWELTLYTREGVFVATRRGALSDPGRVLARPIPWTLTRGETVDALPVAGVPLGYGHRIDGVVTWRTSAGEFEVPVHVDQ